MRGKSMLRKFFEYGLVLSILYASLLLILLTLPYIHFIPGIEFLETKQLIYHIDWWRWSFYIHIFSSPVVIISGIIQFNRSLQQKKPVLHRKIGNLYVLFVLFISGPSGLIMSFYANAGYPAQISFVTLSMLWILSTFLGYYTIRNGNRKKHVLWMFRSYALTLSAVTLRFYAYLFDVFKIDLPPQETYILLAYISWIPNLLFVEILNKAGYLKTYS